jgi:hypothetical protein
METDNVDIAVDVMEDSVAVAAPSDSPSSSEGETTEARQAPPEPEPACQGTENRVTILQADANGTLANIGKIGGIACGETIWSARFIGERGYLVTFRNIDPLWVIDLSEPTAPTILGELEVPGVSTYIHPVDENTLMTIGIGPANEDGTGLDSFPVTSTKIALKCDRAAGRGHRLRLHMSTRRSPIGHQKICSQYHFPPTGMCMILLPSMDEHIPIQDMSSSRC